MKTDELFKEFDFVKFHTPMNAEEQSEIYLVVDELADNNEVPYMKVMEIHQKLSIPVINTFRKSDFSLHHRPSKEEIKTIKKGVICNF